MREEILNRHSKVIKFILKYNRANKMSQLDKHRKNLKIQEKKRFLKIL